MAEGEELWSHGSSTMYGDNGYDVEKTATAVSSPEGTRKYELKTLSSGMIKPVRMDGADEMGLLGRPSTVNGEEARPAWVLPTPMTGVYQQDGLRSFRATIEPLPPVPVSRNGSKGGPQAGAQ